MNIFIESLQILFENVKNTTKKMCWCGDYNLDLLRYDMHSGTKRFLDFMYSYGLYPVITKPSRFSEFNATLIDNIFTNEMTNTGIVSGLLITDVSDHLPVFALCKGIDVQHSFK